MDLSKTKESKNFEDRSADQIGFNLGKTIASIMLALGVEERMPPLTGEPDVTDAYGVPIYPKSRVDPAVVSELERVILGQNRKRSKVNGRR